MYFSIDTEIHFKIIKLCDDLFDEFSRFSKKYPYVSNIGRKNLANFSKSFEWGLYQEIDDILRCYPHSPNFFEPTIDHSLNSICTIKTFLKYTNCQSQLLEKTRQCWNESIELIKKFGEIWDETKSGFDDFNYDPSKIYHEWTEDDDKKALYISLFEKEYLPYSKKQIADIIGVYVFNLNLRVLKFRGIEGCHSYLLSPGSSTVSPTYRFHNQSDLLFIAFKKRGHSMDILEKYQPIIMSYLNRITMELARYFLLVLPQKNPQELSNSDLLQLLKIFEENFSTIQEKENKDFNSSLNTLKEMKNIRNKWAHNKPFNPPSIDDIQSDLDCMRKFVRLINGQPQLADEIFSTWKEAVNSFLIPTSTTIDQRDITETDQNKRQLRESTEGKQFIVGKIYNRRKDIHEKYKGNPNSGISDCANFPFVFLFWSPEGKDFDYIDGWIEPNRLFQYSGGGQDKDMEFTRGNKAVRDHEKNNKELHLFQKVEPGNYKYIGQFRLKETKIIKKKFRFIQFFLELVQ